LTTTILEAQLDISHCGFVDMANTQQSMGVCHLLKLAAELRNSIWRYSVVAEEETAITPDGFAVPSLLSTCHEIRNEAVGIFYAENTFRIRLQTYDSTPLIRFGQVCKHNLMTKDGKFHSSNLKLGMLVAYEPHLQNLMNWLHGCHTVGAAHVFWGLARRDCDDLLALNAKPAAVNIIGAMFDIVYTVRDEEKKTGKMAWSFVERLLKTHLKTLQAIDKRWAIEPAEQ
jgi:hypothetical protein